MIAWAFSFSAQRQKWWHGAGAERRRREGSMKRPRHSEKKRLAPLPTHDFHEKAVKPKLKFTSTRIPKGVEFHGVVSLGVGL